MDLTDAQQKLRQITHTASSVEWNAELTIAIQRVLAEIYLLNPCGDVDGVVGNRTLNALNLFKEVANLANPDVLDPTTAGRLVQASADPTFYIGKVKVKLQKDFDFWRQAHLDENRTNSAKAITDAASSAGLSKPQIAYVLATAEHESDSFKTLEEYADGSNYEKRQDLGNSEKGDGPRFKGRGYVQLTGRRNYTLYRDITGTELVKLPFIMMNWSALAVFVLVHGMTNGIYTGQRLDTFVNERSQNFIDARQVVNDHDRADKIAAQANDWLKQL